MFGLFAQKRIYLDYAGATPALDGAVEIFEKTARGYGNPSAVHQEGMAARAVLETARLRIARKLGVKAREIVFTSGATEANNLAILGRVRRLELRGVDFAKTHWMVSALEHPSVLECFAEIERKGGRVSFVDPNERGTITSESVQKILKPETVFVSIGWANHEIGAIQPIRDIARVIREHEEKYRSTITFHCDAGQAPLYLSPQVHTLGADLMTFDAGKLYAPRGIGLLVGKRHRGQEGELLAPIIEGGGQEYGMRAGTENVALAAAFAESFAIIAKERESEARRVRALRDELARELIARIPDLVVNGDLTHALPHMLNVSIPNIQSEYLVLQLDQAGIAVSTKSSCKEGERFSHVVRALGGEAWRAENTIRFSLGRSTTEREITKAVTVLKSLLSVQS